MADREVVKCYGCGISNFFVRVVQIHMVKNSFYANDTDFVKCVGCGFVYKVTLDADIIHGTGKRGVTPKPKDGQ